MTAWPEVTEFVRASLPPAPARVLEVGAGAGELAAVLADDGYDVVAIDPEPGSPSVRPVALHELDEPEASFDAAIAVVSLHHVEPLDESLRRLAELVQGGDRLVVDEFDVERFDTRAARWRLDHESPEGEHAVADPEALVADLREHLHSAGRLRHVLEKWFELGDPVRGPYLYRWDLPPGLREVEERLIAEGRLPVTGVRWTGTR